MDNVVTLPPRQRVVAAPLDTPAPEEASPLLVDHDGRAYRLADLMGRLSPLKLARIEAAVPRTGQEAWDMVARSWPALAGEIVAGCLDQGRE